jgi:hypothetical protein
MSLLDTTLDTLLDAMTAFLKAHPREVLLVHLDFEEQVYANHDCAHFKLDADAFAANRWNNAEYAAFFWKGAADGDGGPPLSSGVGATYPAAPEPPTLGHARGKIVLVPGFYSDRYPDGGPAPSVGGYGPADAVYATDCWKLNCRNPGLYPRWEGIKAFLESTDRRAAGGRRPSAPRTRRA